MIGTLRPSASLGIGILTLVVALIGVGCDRLGGLDPGGDSPTDGLPAELFPPDSILTDASPQASLASLRFTSRRRPSEVVAFYEQAIARMQLVVVESSVGQDAASWQLQRPGDTPLPPRAIFDLSVGPGEDGATDVRMVFACGTDIWCGP
jgi:hypothetical protein